MKTALVLCLATLARPLAAQDTTSARAQDTSGVQVRNDSISLRFVDADLRGVVQVLGGYLDRPVMVSNLPGARVSLETPHPVPRAELAHLLDGLLQANSLQLVADSSYYRIAPLSSAPPIAQGTPGGSASEAGGPQLFVIRLKHAAATAVASTLKLLFGTGGEFSRGAAGAPTLSQELRRNIVPPMQGPPPQAQAPPGAAPRRTSSRRRTWSTPWARW